MKPLLRFFALSILVMSLLTACSKQDEPRQQLTYTQLLTGTGKKAWHMVSYEVFDNEISAGVQPVEALLQACEADDQFVFYANAGRKLEYINGPSKCDGQEPDVVFTDTWALLNGDSSLEFVIPFLGGKVPWIVKNLTETSLTVEYLFPDLNSRYRFTFSSAGK